MHSRVLMGSMWMVIRRWVPGVHMLMVPSGTIHARSHGHHTIELSQLCKEPKICSVNTRYPNMPEIRTDGCSLGLGNLGLRIESELFNFFFVPLESISSRQFGFR